MSGKSIFQASLVEALEYAVKYGNLEVRVVCGAALERYRKAQAEGSKIQGMEADLVILDELSQQADPAPAQTEQQPEQSGLDVAAEAILNAPDHIIQDLSTWSETDGEPINIFAWEWMRRAALSAQRGEA